MDTKERRSSQTMQIFISHSSVDAAIAKEFCTYMERNGQKCFLAPRDIRPGHEYAEELIDGIDSSDLFLLLLSQKANDSPHVLREVEHAVNQNLPIIVYQLEDVNLSKSMQYFLMTHQWIKADKNKEFKRILEYVREIEAEKKETAVPEPEPEPAPAPVPTPAKAKNPAPGLDPKNKYLPIAIAAAALVVLIAIIALILLFTRDKGDTPPEASKPVASVSQESSESSTPESTEPVSENQPTMLGHVELGDTIEFGSFNGVPIEWRVLHLAEQDGQHIAILVSKYILTMRGYAVPESGTYNYENNTDYYDPDSPAEYDLDLQARIRGDSIWNRSTIRIWLNSDREHIDYGGKDPVSTAFSDYSNGYKNEPGFLNGFSKEERDELVPYKFTTSVDGRYTDGPYPSEDKVFLLSLEEMDWFDEADVSKVTSPTPEAITSNGSPIYGNNRSLTGSKDFIWWLRTPRHDKSSQCYLVDTGYRREYSSADVAVEGYGIRPAICVRVDE